MEAVEEEGVIRSLVKIVRVQDLANTNADERTLWEALAVSGVPVQGDRAAGNTNLVLHRRTVSPIQSSPTQARIVCEYKTIADWTNSFIFSGGTTMEQTQTDVDYYGNRIALSYTYPNDYPDENLRGEIYTTAINESVMVPGMTLTATGSLYVNYPNEIALQWLGHCNDTFWAGAPAYSWLCIGCDFTSRDIGLGRAHLWEFTWTFCSGRITFACVWKMDRVR